MDVGDFAVYNPVAGAAWQPQGEALAATGKKDTVSVARLTVGYDFTENWGLHLSYTDFGTGEASMAFPQYPGIVWAMMIGVGPDVYQRHVLKYKTSAFTLMPSYTFRVNEKLGIRAGVGVSYTKTSSHFEATYTRGTVIFPVPTPQSYSYAKATEQSLGYIVSLGADYLITNRLSLGLSGNATTFKMKVPATAWTNSSQSKVKNNSFGAELALTWHW